MNEWWGYLHSNGKPILKVFTGDHRDYTDDCEGNDFVVKVIPPFTAENREEAMKILIRRIG